MKLPVHSSSDSLARSAPEVRDMAVAVQANLVTLKVAESRRNGFDPEQHDIRVPSPGTVGKFREILIDREHLAPMSNPELHLNLRQVWGQFCMMVWLLCLREAPQNIDFTSMPNADQLRCPTELDVKHVEVQAIAWALRFEQRRRQDPDFARSTRFAEDQGLADKIPARPFGKPMHHCPDTELLMAEWEHRGMLAALRWAMDRRRRWNEPGIMEVENRPFD